MREIVLDTETTGLKHEEGHRIIEIGALELNDYIPTGTHYHVRINPERDIDAEASKVHGMTAESLKHEPLFADIADEFLAFIGDDPLIIHNAEFDVGFINAELKRIERTTINMARTKDTLLMARKKFPGSPASLDALCRRFDIDTAKRQLHGALIDVYLLAEVYIELIGGRQLSLMADDTTPTPAPAPEEHVMQKPTAPVKLREFPISEDEQKAHAEFMTQIKDPIWGKY